MDDHLFTRINQNRNLCAEAYLPAESNNFADNKQTSDIPDLNASHTVHQFVCHCEDTSRKNGGACAPVVSEIGDSSFARTENEREKSCLADRDTAHGFRSPDWPWPSVVILRNRNLRVLAYCEDLLIYRLKPLLELLTHSWYPNRD